MAWRRDAPAAEDCRRLGAVWPCAATIVASPTRSVVLRSRSSVLRALQRGLSGGSARTARLLVALAADPTCDLAGPHVTAAAASVAAASVLSVALAACIPTALGS